MHTGWALGRNVRMDTGLADGPEVRRAGRRLGLKNMGPSAGRVGAKGPGRNISTRHKDLCTLNRTKPQKFTELVAQIVYKSHKLH